MWHLSTSPLKRNTSRIQQQAPADQAFFYPELQFVLYAHPERSYRKWKTNCLIGQRIVAVLNPRSEKDIPLLTKFHLQRKIFLLIHAHQIMQNKADFATAHNAINLNILTAVEKEFIRKHIPSTIFCFKTKTSRFPGITSPPT